MELPVQEIISEVNWRDDQKHVSVTRGRVGWERDNGSKGELEMGCGWRHLGKRH